MLLADHLYLTSYGDKLISAHLNICILYNICHINFVLHQYYIYMTILHHMAKCDKLCPACCVHREVKASDILLTEAGIVYALSAVYVER